MRRIRCFGIAVCALTSLAATSLVGCGRPRAEPGNVAVAAAAAAPKVEVVQVAPRAWPLAVRVQGTLVEDESALLGAKVAGRVQLVAVDVGSRVERGQTVAVLDPDEFDLKVQQAQAQVAQARAKLGLKGDAPEDKLDVTKAAPVMQEQALLDDARLNVQRVRKLTDKAVFTQEEIQARESTLHVAEARYASAVNSVHEQIAILALRRAELALALQNRKDAELKAPFDGIIQQRRVAPGSYVSIGQPVATLVRIDPLRFRAGVPERAASGVQVGQPVQVWLEGQPEGLEAKITRISPALDVGSRSLLVEADIPNSAGRWRSGLFAEGEIVVDPQQQALAIPLTSIVSFGGVEKVWAVSDSRATPRTIRIGRRNDQYAEVIDGLKSGDVILTDGKQGREGAVQASVRQPATAPDQAAQLDR